MSLVLGDNFDYKASKPLDGRLKYDTLASMKAVADATMYDGCMAYCAGTDKTYQWKSTNTVDETLGRWREFSSGGGGGSSYTAGDGIDITEDVISTKQSEEGDIDEIIDVYPTAGNLVSIVNAFNRGDIYSTDEKMIGQWINGKPLYQRVYNLSPSVNIPANDWVDTTINSSGMETIVNARAVVIGISVDMLCAKNNTGTSKIAVLSAVAKTIDTLILQYTKTTDTAISIGSETEYSTDEKVVGTWIDGKPLYQKTITGLTVIADGQLTTLDSNVVVRNIEGITENGSPLNNYSGANYYIYTCANNTAHTIYMKNAGYTGQSCYITIQYTKTT